jgi:hypothetical protein
MELVALLRSLKLLILQLGLAEWHARYLSLRNGILPLCDTV